MQHRDRIAQLGFGEQEDGNLDAHSGQNWRRLGAGRPRWKTLASGFPSRREEKDILSGEPADDDSFIGVFAHELEYSGGYTPEEAKEVARKLFPDILSSNPREPVRYPDNGRTLTDDVVDLFFSIYTNRNVTDKVGPHQDLLAEFPYLGPPH